MSKGTDTQSLAKRIKEVQEYYNLNSRNFAIEIGMDPSQMSKIEKGRLGLSAKSAMAINERFGVNVNWILTGKGDKGIWNNIPHESIPITAEKNELLGETEERLLRIEAHLEVYENAIAGLLSESNKDFMEIVGKLRTEVQAAVKRRLDALKKK